MPSRAGERIACGIVLFNPDAGTVLRLIDAIRCDADAVIVFANSPIGQELELDLRERRAVTIQSRANVGIGGALNQIVRKASDLGFDVVALFDQDSRPGSDLIGRLKSGRSNLIARGANVAVVGPELVSRELIDGARHKAPRYYPHPSAVESPNDALAPVLYLPTSGTLISIDAFRAIGPFRDDYFIDGIDLEWCFRAWSKGYSCWLATDVTMEHTVGEGSVGAIGFRTPHQKDFRLETYVRNTVYGFRLPHIPLSWKLRQAAYLVAQVAFLSVANHFRPSLLKRLGRGFVNGLRGRLGPPEGVPFT